MIEWRWIEIAPGVHMVAFDGDPVLHHPYEYCEGAKPLEELIFDLQVSMPSVEPTLIPPDGILRRD